MESIVNSELPSVARNKEAGDLITGTDRSRRKIRTGTNHGIIRTKLVGVPV